MLQQVQLGVPLEIVTNTISKRKTDVAVMFDRGDRLFGEAYGSLPARGEDCAVLFSTTHSDPTLLLALTFTNLYPHLTPTTALQTYLNNKAPTPRA